MGENTNIYSLLGVFGIFIANIYLNDFNIYFVFQILIIYFKV